MNAGNLLDKVVKKLGESPFEGTSAPGSILTIAAAQYGSGARLGDDVTQPTGFDPQAAALFESVVEAAFLVATADGEFDAVEKGAFKHVVLTVCHGAVSDAQVTALLADLEDLVAEDGVDKRVTMVARTIRHADQAREVLRVAGLMAYVSDGVSEVERGVLCKLARELQLPPEAVSETLSEVARSLDDRISHSRE